MTSDFVVHQAEWTNAPDHSDFTTLNSADNTGASRLKADVGIFTLLLVCSLTHVWMYFRLP